MYLHLVGVWTRIEPKQRKDKCKGGDYWLESTNRAKNRGPTENYRGSVTDSQDKKQLDLEKNRPMRANSQTN